MTCRLESDGGNSAVHPYSLREESGVIRSSKFPDKDSFSEPSKPAGCGRAKEAMTNLKKGLVKKGTVKNLYKDLEGD